MKTKPTMNNMRGFTLVELMIVVLLTAIAAIAIYRGYTAFSQSANAQEQIIEMQQNLRIGMYFISKDLMRAGMTEEDNTILEKDGVRKDVKEVTFITAMNYPDLVNPDDPLIELGLDLGSGGVFAADGVDNDRDEVDDNDADAAVAAREAQEEGRVGDDDIDDDGERIIYRLSNDEDSDNDDVLDPGEDLNGNGLLDKNLQRKVWDSSIPGYPVAWQTVINNVSRIDFVYLDKTGAVTAVTSDIDTVVVTLVVHTTNEDYRVTNNDPYKNLLNATIYTAPGDNFRRRAMSTRIKIRNANM